MRITAALCLILALSVFVAVADDAADDPGPMWTCYEEVMDENHEIIGYTTAWRFHLNKPDEAARKYVAAWANAHCEGMTLRERFIVVERLNNRCKEAVARARILEAAIQKHIKATPADSAHESAAREHLSKLLVWTIAPMDKHTQIVKQNVEGAFAAIKADAGR